MKDRLTNHESQEALDRRIRRLMHKMGKAKTPARMKRNQEVEA